MCRLRVSGIRLALWILSMTVAAPPGIVFADTFYVWTNSPQPGLPYNAWSNAARTIQDAVDAARGGDSVIVTDGVYSAGARVTPGYALSNRVVVTNAILVRSVNGPDCTSIVGSPASGGGYGADAVRCVYMSAGTLSGFTLTNGCTRDSGGYTNDCSGGGVLAVGAEVTNCLITGNRAYWLGGGVCGGTIRNCRITTNSAAAYGGGAYDAALFDCEIALNTANDKGGGACWGTLSNCVLAANMAYQVSVSCGGGAYRSELVDCVVWSNIAYCGGGVGEGRAVNCLIATNRGQYGGGAYGATLVGCVITANYSQAEGGGARFGVLDRCMLLGNYGWSGGGRTGRC